MPSIVQGRLTTGSFSGRCSSTYFGWSNAGYYEDIHYCARQFIVCPRVHRGLTRMLEAPMLKGRKYSFPNQRFPLALLVLGMILMMPPRYVLITWGDFKEYLAFAKA